ncbi:hypothetical protein M947_06040 [Sulfurimonas hongkongensis]|uniref:Dinitrogenase iron-molybdenum cofactor biosynthesis domain-containing protein n=1 Tax=Sulfurimonas hongkongensis TaxID=1172190 RepID=T0KR78_9BACT|nr:hypothetical protein [Sulfurimonas hongkongensis]EQB39549.1 hypothetical protein M947_06040 [Sulfurimonas hongkongensis]
MYILLPMSSDDVSTSSLSKIDDAKIWTQVLVENGQLLEANHSSDRDGFSSLSECAVVIDDNEYVWPFMEQNMMVLVAHTQRNLEEIIEAYLFKELHELAY